VRTALDTNVISAIWSAERSAEAILELLGVARAEGALVIAAPVYAELLAYPKMTPEKLEGFLDGGWIEADFSLNQDVWREAGLRFARYASRLRLSKDGQPRLLTDFVIGAHALLQAERLMTLDVTRYRRDFPEIKLITIS
jgi:predicted nucleic acid-binding protein